MQAVYLCFVSSGGLLTEWDVIYEKLHISNQRLTEGIQPNHGGCRQWVHEPLIRHCSLLIIAVFILWVVSDMIAISTTEHWPLTIRAVLLCIITPSLQHVGALSSCYG